MSRETLGDGFKQGGIDPFVQTEDALYAKQYDQVDTTLAYLGEAQPGTAQNVAKWRIQRITFTPGGSVGVTWADGNTSFDNVWSDRATLNYS